MCTVGQDKPYDPSADALAQINKAVAEAKRQNKHVLVQVGGNWCKWCLKLTGFISSHQRIDSLITADYVLIKVNYSMENKNPEAMEMLDFPQRFGFPVFVVLDSSGKRIHTQNTAYLEEDDGYSEKKISEFLLSWNIQAVNPENYKP